MIGRVLRPSVISSFWVTRPTAPLLQTSVAGTRRQQASASNTAFDGHHYPHRDKTGMPPCLAWLNRIPAAEYTNFTGSIDMSGAIGGAGGCSSAMMGGMNGMQRPDPSKIVDNLFSKLDTK